MITTAVLPYTDVSSCDNTRNVDALFARYTTERNNVVSLLKYSPDKLEDILYGPESPISVDTQCLCQLGKNYISSIEERIMDRDSLRLPQLNRRQYSCAQCTNLGRLTDFKSKTVGSPIPIMYGMESGTSILIAEEKLHKQTIVHGYEPAKLLRQILMEESGIENCEPDLPNLLRAKFMGSSTFTNRTLVTWYTSSLVNKIGSKGINTIRSSFICGDTGFYLVDIPNIGTSEKLMTRDKYLTQDFETDEIRTRETIITDVITANPSSFLPVRRRKEDHKIMRSSNLPISTKRTRTIIRGFGNNSNDLSRTGNIERGSDGLNINDEFIVNDTTKLLVKAINTTRRIDSMNVPIEPIGDKYLKPSITKGIILQLVSLLHYLKDYDFSLGGAGLDNLLFDSRPTSYQYDDVTIMSEITLKLNELGFAGITVKDDKRDVLPLGMETKITRLYNYSDTDSLRITANPFVPVVITMKIIPSLDISDGLSCSIPGNNNSDKSYLVYRINTSSSSTIEKNGILFSYFQHLGIPLYQSSFDLYTLWLMLMTFPKFYDSVMSDTNLKRVWISLWVPEEYDNMDIRLRKIHTDKATNIKCSMGTDRLELIRFLSDFRLRCDATDMVWDQLKVLTQ